MSSDRRCASLSHPRPLQPAAGRTRSGGRAADRPDPPCNVVLHQDAAGGVRVELMDPAAGFKLRDNLIDNSAIGELAAEVRAKLERVTAALA